MRRRVLPLLLLAALVLQGCWNRVEVNDLAIVSMMAVDKTESGDMELWLHVVVPAQASAAKGDGGGGGGGTQGGGHAFITLRAEGRTIMEAARRLQNELPRRIFWAHARVIIIGENLTKDGVRSALDFITRHRELRLTNFLVTVKGSVSEIMATQTELERLPSEHVREITRSRVGTAVTVGEFAENLAAKGAEPTMGALAISSPPPGAPPSQKSTLRLAGTALFKDDKLVGFLDETGTRGLLWLQNKMRMGTATVELPKAPGPISLEWVRASVNRTARLEGGKVVIEVSARVEADVNEERAKLDLSDPQSIALVETAMEKQVRQHMENALARLKALNADAAGLGEVVHRQLPIAWKRLEKNWKKDGFKQARVLISVDARVRRTGLSSKPKGVPEEQLIKGGQ